MTSNFTKNISIYGLIIIFSLTIIFHLLVIVGVVPYEIVWGGRLTNHSQMLIFESVSITINLLMLWVVVSYAGFLRRKLNLKWLKVAFWVMFFLFSLNTIGNLNSSNQTEKMIFTPVTVLLAVFCLRLALSKRSGESF
ncbi:hypothetical protein JKA74_01735 [Marivirga sp. S37H4]|uniref:Uncharacterized protein n=1 Tax=Marivirga aurantiaca TaxID=2802615 RepID=A0A935C5A6_9BACT|nr:hypothetical protein [Marivirga aurantiaca]MBK6263741.1 hypothetical protein [Marivirga aurantiaca]